MADTPRMKSSKMNKLLPSPDVINITSMEVLKAEILNVIYTCSNINGTISAGMKMYILRVFLSAIYVYTQKVAAWHCKNDGVVLEMRQYLR